jgi:ABC-2 type transport system permease protein
MPAVLAQAWLILRNDLRLLWRELGGRKLRAFLSFALIGAVFVLLNLAAVFVCWVLKPHVSLTAETTVWLFFGFIMLGAAMNHAVRVLFERADFDLLLSSPVSSRAIMLARLATMTSAAALSVAFFLLPPLNGFIIGVSGRYTAGYLVWILLACAVGSLGVFGTLLLVRWLGARRARTWSQVVAAVLGASIYILFQSQNLLPFEARRRAVLRFGRWVHESGAEFLARAGRGELLPLVGLLAVSATLAGASTYILGRLFVTGVQESGAAVSRRSEKLPRHNFVSGVIAATFWKDLRLIMRDPLLFAQVLPSVMYIVPVLFSLKRLGVAAVLAPLTVIIATQFSAALTAVAASGEECWDLIRMSPTPEFRMRWAKAMAGMAVPAVIVILISVLLAVLSHPVLGVIAAITSLGCAAAAAWLQVINIKPTPRRDVLRRGRAKVSTGRSLSTALLVISGAAAVGVAAASHWAIAAVLVGITAAIIIGVFTLAEVKPIEAESFASRAGDAANGA